MLDIDSNPKSLKEETPRIINTHQNPDSKSSGTHQTLGFLTENIIQVVELSAKYLR